MLSAKVEYMSEEEYKDLSREEVKNYWANLEQQLADFQERKANALAQQNAYQTRIAELKEEKQAVDAEYDRVYNEILAMLGVDKTDYSGIREKIAYFNSEVDNWQGLSDKELWNEKKQVKELVAEYNQYRNTPEAKVPDFRTEFSDLDNRINNLERSLAAAKPKYYEDSYTVVRGDWLSKIAGYSFIYDDYSKWPIIYRANRDQIKDPNLIYPDQVLKIPRGLPNTWKVYKGECLWKIAAYPEVYGSGAKWPVIYRANKDKIKDPDLIYPNQIFEIPRD
ncbi:MAG: hypothetical protein PWQ09_466 [Candidatus Cloacimonadota bacterium]|nr:hypothetical protein [Candidatus Cloacimonadota bacterium]